MTQDLIEPEVTGILVCKDLFFTASVTATARAQGLAMKVCLGPSQLPGVLTSNPGVKAVIVDLKQLDPDDPQVFISIRDAAPRPIVLAGFGSHVDTRRFKVAQEAGFDQVLPNSAFSGRLVEWLRAWMG